MPEFVTDNLEHNMSGQYLFTSGAIMLPIVETLPSGIQNQIVFVQISGQLAIFNEGWRVVQGS